LIPIEADWASDHYAERERMRPGITGPWQVHGRSDIGFDDMVRLDYTYAMHWSLAEDVRILIRTASAVGAGRGAY
jgi:lipopolysaccharide/colanic/teichoic acid biosynthesis glycosyltransferase